MAQWIFLRWVCSPAELHSAPLGSHTVLWPCKNANVTHHFQSDPPALAPTIWCCFHISCLLRELRSRIGRSKPQRVMFMTPVPGKCFQPDLAFTLRHC